MKVLITGVSSGIGNELTKHLIKRGYEVVGISRNKEKLQSLEKEVNSKRLKIYPCDVSNYKDVLSVRENLVKSDSLPDIIILCAGIFLNDLKPTYNSQISQEVFSTNLFGVFNFIDLFLPSFLKKGKGQFIALSSISAFRPNKNGVAYSASKSALSLSFRGFNLAYQKKNIVFSNISLGPVDTNMWEGKKSFLVANTKKIAREIEGVIKTRRRNYFIPFFSTLLFRISRVIPDRIYCFLSEKVLK